MGLMQQEVINEGAPKIKTVIDLRRLTATQVLQGILMPHT